jgi:hypothetical protein
MAWPSTRRNPQPPLLSQKHLDLNDDDELAATERPKRTVKAPQVFTFSSPNNNVSPSPAQPPAKKKRKKRKKPSERIAQENVEAMRESRARNLSPSSDEDDDLHKKPPAHGVGEGDGNGPSSSGSFSGSSREEEEDDDNNYDDSSSHRSSAVNANNILASN